MSSTAIIILNYNNPTDTINCIESIEKQNSADIKYIVVDNGSPNKDGVEELKNHIATRFNGRYNILTDNSQCNGKLSYMNLLISDTNDGYARGNNKGLAHALEDEDVEDILILNNDIILTNDILPSLKKNLKELPDAGTVSPILVGRDNNIDVGYDNLLSTEWEMILQSLFLGKDIFGVISNQRERCFILNKDNNIEKDSISVEIPNGAAFLIKKETMKSIGCFDPHTFLYFEENILYKKLSKIGKKIYLLPKERCIHLGASTTNTIPKSSVYKSFQESKDYFLKTYCELSILQKLTWQFAKSLSSARNAIKKRIEAK